MGQIWYQMTSLSSTLTTPSEMRSCGEETIYFLSIGEKTRALDTLWMVTKGAECRICTPVRHHVHQTDEARSCAPCSSLHTCGARFTQALQLCEAGAPSAAIDQLSACSPYADARGRVRRTHRRASIPVDTSAIPVSIYAAISVSRTVGASENVGTGKVCYVTFHETPFLPMPRLLP